MAHVPKQQIPEGMCIAAKSVSDVREEVTYNQRRCQTGAKRFAQRQPGQSPAIKAMPRNLIRALAPCSQSSSTIPPSLLQDNLHTSCFTNIYPPRSIDLQKFNPKDWYKACGILFLNSNQISRNHGLDQFHTIHIKRTTFTPNQELPPVQSFGILHHAEGDVLLNQACCNSHKPVLYPALNNPEPPQDRCSCFAFPNNIQAQIIKLCLHTISEAQHILCSLFCFIPLIKQVIASSF